MKEWSSQKLCTKCCFLWCAFPWVCWCWLNVIANWAAAVVLFVRLTASAAVVLPSCCMYSFPLTAKLWVFLVLSRKICRIRMWQVYCSSSSSKTDFSYSFNPILHIFFPLSLSFSKFGYSIPASLRTDFLCGHLYIITSESYTAADLTPLLHDTEDGHKKLCPISHSGSLKKIIKRIIFSSLFLQGENYQEKKCRCPNLMDLFFKYNQNVCFTKSDVLGEWIRILTDQGSCPILKPLL